MSVAAGIPDFRSSTGLFATLRADLKLKSSGQAMFDASVYKVTMDGSRLVKLIRQDYQSVEAFHRMIRDLHNSSMVSRPTKFHELLASLSSSNRLMRLYTQNVDFLETRLPALATIVPLPAKGPWPKSITLHGSLEKMHCTKCAWIGNFDSGVFVGDEMPDCRECTESDDIRVIAGKRPLGVGSLRPRMVLYNEHNPDGESIGSCAASDLRSRPDALLVVGTSLKVPGVRRIVREMANSVGNRGHIVWINTGPPPISKEFGDVWDFVVKGSCQAVAELMDGYPIRHRDLDLQGSLPSSQSSLASMPKVQEITGTSQYWSIVMDGGPFRSHLGLPTPYTTPSPFEDSSDESTPGQTIFSRDAGTEAAGDKHLVELPAPPVLRVKNASHVQCKRSIEASPPSNSFKKAKVAIPASCKRKKKATSIAKSKRDITTKTVSPPKRTPDKNMVQTTIKPEACAHGTAKKKVNMPKTKYKSRNKITAKTSSVPKKVGIERPQTVDISSVFRVTKPATKNSTKLSATSKGTAANVLPSDRVPLNSISRTTRRSCSIVFQCLPY